jgi:hypothetical protein
MTTTRRGSRADLYPLDNLFVSFHRSPAGTAWRWRTELITLGSVAAALLWLASQLHSITWASVVLAVALALVFILPWSRRFTIARFWCVLARHRFQRLCWEARLHTRAGKLPAVLWVRPTKVGERLFVWCLAGIAAEDFEQHTGELRAACYARDARVTRNIRWSQLVTVDIIRRDTLAAANTVSSPLTQLATTRRQATQPRPPVPALSGNRPAWPDGPTRTELGSPE